LVKISKTLWSILIMKPKIAALLGFFSGMAVADISTSSDIKGFVGGIVNFGGKIGKAFMDTGGKLWHITGSAGKTLSKIPLKDRAGNILGINPNFPKNTLNTVGSMVGGVWHAVTDSSGRQVKAFPVQPMKQASDGSLWGINNENITDAINDLKPIAQESLNALSPQIIGEPISNVSSLSSDDGTAGTGLSPVPEKKQLIPGIDNNLLLFGGGGIVIIVLVLLLRRGSRR